MPEVKTNEETTLKRLLWRCRRGTKELDLILGAFVKIEYQKLAANDQERFNKLLETEDPILTDWLCHQIKPDNQEMEKIVSRILSSNIV